MAAVVGLSHLERERRNSLILRSDRDEEPPVCPERGDPCAQGAAGDEVV
jgi:hypothetical protein